MERNCANFFQNTLCEYFPCHKTDDPDSFNCLFCYCPLYALGEECGGSFGYTKSGVKTCVACSLPHTAAGCGHIREKLPLILKLAARKGSEAGKP